jgi:hypothetical protein
MNPNQAEMAVLVFYEKKALERLDTAREELALWVERGKLAARKGRPILARQAKARALEAKAELDRAQADLNGLQAKKKALRSGRPAGPSGAETIRAETLVEQFRMRGLAPEEAELDEMQRRAEADVALAAMKGEPMPSQAPSAAASAEVSGQDHQAAGEPAAHPAATAEPSGSPPPPAEALGPPAPPDELPLTAELQRLIEKARTVEVDEDFDIEALERELQGEKAAGASDATPGNDAGATPPGSEPSGEDGDAAASSPTGSEPG